MTASHTNHPRLWRWCMLAWLLAIGMTGCAVPFTAMVDSPIPTVVPGDILPFEVVAEGIHLNHQDAEVLLFFATKPEEIDPALADYPELYEKVQAIDFDGQAVIVLTRQLYGDLEHRIVPEHVVLQDDTLVVYVKLLVPGPNTAVSATSGGVYAVMTVPWDGPSSDQIATELVTYVDYY